jgi:hypothetical protein
MGEYRLDGCAIGFPAQNPPKPEIAAIEDVTSWFI